MKKYWWQMCLQPQKTFEKVRQQRSSKTFHCLASIMGLPITLHLMQDFSLGITIPAFFLWLLALLLSPFVGMAAIYIFGGILYLVGKKLKGHGSALEIRHAIAWSNIPMMLSTFSWLIITLLFGSSLFTTSFMDRIFGAGGEATLLVTSLLQFIAVVWSFVLLLRTLSIVQGFSILKAAINILLPYLVLSLIALLLR
jgi:hypothetical protein